MRMVVKETRRAPQELRQRVPAAMKIINVQLWSRLLTAERGTLPVTGRGGQLAEIYASSTRGSVRLRDDDSWCPFGCYGGDDWRYQGQALGQRQCQRYCCGAEAPCNIVNATATTLNRGGLDGSARPEDQIDDQEGNPSSTTATLGTGWVMVAQLEKKKGWMSKLKSHLRPPPPQRRQRYR